MDFTHIYAHSFLTTIVLFAFECAEQNLCTEEKEEAHHSFHVHLSVNMSFALNNKFLSELTARFWVIISLCLTYNRDMAEGKLCRTGQFLFEQ